MMKQYTPSNILIQWHITNKCNYRCKHCYQNDFEGEGRSTTEMLNVIDRVHTFTKQLSEKQERKIKLHFNITGGEPFLRHDIIDLAARLADLKIRFGILSNGSYITDNVLVQLKKYGLTFVQLSLEGKPSTNDAIRAKGSFKAVKAGIRILKKHKIPVMISFTASKTNYKEFIYVAQFARKMRVDKLWTDRYLPINKKDMNVLTADETKEYFNIVYHEKNKKWRNRIAGTEIAMDRALQFLVAENIPYYCKAGDSLLTIMPDGTIYPCRRMPIETGNIFKDNLFELYQKHPLFVDLRNAQKADRDCQDCFFGDLCKGGLRCLSYAVQNNPFAKDPACWR